MLWSAPTTCLRTLMVFVRGLAALVSLLLEIGDERLCDCHGEDELGAHNDELGRDALEFVEDENGMRQILSAAASDLRGEVGNLVGNLLPWDGSDWMMSEEVDQSEYQVFSTIQNHFRLIVALHS